MKIKAEFQWTELLASLPFILQLQRSYSDTKGLKVSEVLLLNCNQNGEVLRWGLGVWRC